MPGGLLWQIWCGQVSSRSSFLNKYRNRKYMFSQGSPENIIVSSFTLFHGNNNNTM
nr:MAG TPA: hypothetical protein [Caudoviricetes sp.]